MKGSIAFFGQAAASGEADLGTAWVATGWNAHQPRPCSIGIPFSGAVAAVLEVSSVRGS